MMLIELLPRIAPVAYVFDSPCSSRGRCWPAWACWPAGSDLGLRYRLTR
jgi:hypothetical protein